ncbi:hypothetical protein HD554DRAFT_1768395 [Boletus coccyginus]|nr:hypothetical protein HD554DRAFT_1768395 [Boletus coccyginus]
MKVVCHQVLLVLRTYAFWQGDKRVLYGLFGYGAVTIGVAVGISVTQTRLFPECKSQATPALFSQFICLVQASTPPGCLLIASRNSTVVYLFLLVFEIVVLSLTTYKRFRAYRKMGTPIVHTLYRDGIIYIVCIILITFSNIIVDGIFPWQFSGLLDLPQIALHSVLASRIMFNLRESSYSIQQGGVNLATLSNIAYHTPLEPGFKSGSLRSNE